MGNTAIAFLQTALRLLIILIVNYATVRVQKLERAPGLNTEEDGSSGCVESINAHSLQTSESHVLVAWMVSPTDSGNNLIITALSGASENRLELTGFRFMLKKPTYLCQN